jgi:hypothetical protein
MKTIGYITTFIVIAALSTMWNGYALSILWGWFIVPTFEAPVLSVGYAIGIAMVVSYLTNHNDPFKNQDEEWKERFSKAIAYGLIKPAIALLFGWVVTLFIN